MRKLVPLVAVASVLSAALVAGLATAAFADNTSAADRIAVDAGADQAVSVGSAVSLRAKVTATGEGPLRMFWSKISGPGTAAFSHESFRASFENGTIGEWTAPSEHGFPGGNRAGGGEVTKERAH